MMLLKYKFKFSAVRSDMPGLNERDKSIRLWLIAENNSLAQGMEESSCMLELLGSTPGPNPQAVINTCYKLFGLVLLKSKVGIEFQNPYLILNIVLYFLLYVKKDLHCYETFI